MRRLVTPIAALAALLLAAAASADLTTRIESLDLSAAPDGIFWVTVPHDGDDWVEPELSDLWAEFVLTVSARTTSSQYALRRVVAGLAMQGYAGAELTVWDESLMDILWTGQTTEIDHQDYHYGYHVRPLRARNACRALHDQLRDQGLSHDEIVSQDRTTTLDDEIHVAVVATEDVGSTEFDSEVDLGLPQLQPDGSYVWGGHWVWTSSWETVAVKCLKRPPETESDELHRDEPREPLAGADALRLPFEVQRIELSIAPKEQAGVCPRQISLKVDVYATAAGTARVRTKTSGSVSPELQVPVTGFPGEAFVGSRVFEATIGRSGEGGFTAEAGPPADGPQLAIASDPDVHQGVYWVEASNGVKSNHAGYRVTCTPPPFEPGLRAGEPPGEPPGPPTAFGAETGGGGGGEAGGPTVMAVDPASLRPDLAIKEVRPDGQHAWRVLVENRGASGAPATQLEADYQLGEKDKKKEVAVPALGAGEERWVRIEFRRKLSAVRPATLRVDPQDRIDETNERNNRKRVN